MQLPPLFIYVPTYNRPIALGRQLGALLPQVASRPDRVRLLVSDNASPGGFDHTLLAPYSACGNIEFRSNGGNIGANANISLGFAFCRPGEFLWILGDNDVVRGDAIQYILDSLEKTIDFYCFVNDVTEPQTVSHNWKEGWERVMDWRMGLISDGLYSADTIAGSVEYAFKYHNSSFPHLAVSCAAARTKGVVTFRLLPRARITAELVSSEEQPTDYSLARVGMPLLVPLFPNWESRDFSRKWLRLHGVQFYLNRHRHPDVFVQTRATLRQYGGAAIQFALALSRVGAMLYPLARIYMKFRKVAVATAKSRLQPETIETLQKVRRRFWRT
jgi:hypothetical protein